MSRFTIDRLEGRQWAVLEDEQGRTFRVPGNWIPEQAREGDVLDAAEDRTSTDVVIRFELNHEARQQRLADANRLRNQLPRGPKGDVSL